VHFEGDRRGERVDVEEFDAVGDIVPMIMRWA
jgi:hypothetical protein